MNWRKSGSNYTRSKLISTANQHCGWSACRTAGDSCRKRCSRTAPSLTWTYVWVNVARRPSTASTRFSSRTATDGFSKTTTAPITAELMTQNLAESDAATGRPLTKGPLTHCTTSSDESVKVTDDIVRRRPMLRHRPTSPLSCRHQAAAASHILSSGSRSYLHTPFTESLSPVIFIPTRVIHICSGGGDLGKLQWMSY